MAKNNVQSVSYLLCTQVIKPQIIHKIRHDTNLHKQNIHKHRTQNFRRTSPFGITLLKRHIRLGHAGIVDHSVHLSIPDFKKCKAKTAVIILKMTGSVMI